MGYPKVLAMVWKKIIKPEREHFDGAEVDEGALKYNLLDDEDLKNAWDR